MTTTGTWYPPSCGTGGFLIELTNPPFAMTDPTDPTQAPELPPEVAAELIAEAQPQPGGILPFANMARLAYAAGVKAGAEGEHQRGADAELEAICEWMERGPFCFSAATIWALRAARRPQPPSLKEQALADLDLARRLAVPQSDGGFDGECILLPAAQAATIRRALESLPDPD